MTAMDLDLAEQIQEKACRRKVAMGRKAAMNLAAHTTVEGNAMSAYRCPFCGEWHVGHVMSIESLRDLATAIRVLSGNGPTDPGAGQTPGVELQDPNQGDPE